MSSVMEIVEVAVINMFALTSLRVEVASDQHV
jgi:hypothetical protein